MQKSSQGHISVVDVAYPLGAIPPQCVSTSFQMISISGTYSCLNAASRDIISCFHVQFADAAGNVMGGRILIYTHTYIFCPCNEIRGEEGEIRE